MKKRGRNLGGALAVAIVAVVAVSLLPVSGPQHVILISIDTLRADHLGCYGHPFVKTPNIDAIAAEGILFEQFTAVAPTTLASHTSLMTGTYPHTHGIARNRFRVHDRNLMMAEVLASEGFDTAAFIGAFPLGSKFNFDQGFRHYDDNYPRTPGNRDGVQRRNARQVTDAVLEWLAKRRSGGLFLFVHYFDVHTPYVHEEPYNSMYREDDLPIRGTIRDIAHVREALQESVPGAAEQSKAIAAQYAAGVTCVDAHLGRLLDGLRELEILDRAILLITSDHGETMDTHPEEYWNHGVTVYDETIRVPLVIRLPGGSMRPSRVNELVSNIDVLPTLLEILALPIPLSVEGRSFAPLLRGQRLDVRPFVFAEATKPHTPRFEADPRWANALKARAVRGARWKMIHEPLPGRTHLYDVREDPGETVNLAERGTEEHAAIVEDLRQKLAAWDASADPADATRIDDPEALERLRALGYVE